MTHHTPGCGHLCITEEAGILASAAACDLGATETMQQDSVDWIKMQAAEHCPKAAKILD